MLEHRPVVESWKISEVLSRYPQLLDVLVTASPAFEKLRNPLLRRVQSRLVTVGQAARVAGLSPHDLVARLNQALGLDVPGPRAAPLEEAPAPPPAWAESTPVAVALDVRPMLARGEEPLSAIQAAATQVPPGAALRLEAPFAPVPLYEVLRKRGFDPWARKLGPAHWEVLFRRGDSVVSEAEAGPGPESDTIPERWDQDLDVTDLAPPEPMVRILETLEGLPPGHTLRVEHHRRPIYLYPRLDELGYTHVTRERPQGGVVLFITRP